MNLSTLLLYGFCVSFILSLYVEETSSKYLRRRQNYRHRSYRRIHAYRYYKYHGYNSLARRQRIAADQVKRTFEAARTVNPDMFAITRPQADNFTNQMLLEEIVRPPYIVCANKTLPKYTDCKILELQDIFASYTCDNKTASRQQASDEHHRVRRMTTTTNSDGSVTDIRACFERRTDTLNNNLRLCKMCAATTTLPQNVFPRFINEIICDRDTTCLTRQGRCYQNYVLLEFRRDTNEVGLNRLAEWPKYRQKVRTCCSCQALKGGLIEKFV